MLQKPLSGNFKVKYLYFHVSLNFISPQKRLQRFLSRNGSNESGSGGKTSEHQRIRSVGSADLDHPAKDRLKKEAKPLAKSHSQLTVDKKDNSVVTAAGNNPISY